MITGNVLIGAIKAPKESDINFRTGSVVYSKKTDQNGIVVTRDQYGRNKMINNAQTPVYFPKTKKIVAVYNRYLVSLDDKGLGGLNYDYYKNRSLEYIEGELTHLDRSYKTLVRVGDNKGAESNRKHTLKLREIYNAKKNK
jgi:hypothetical protein